MHPLSVLFVAPFLMLAACNDRDGGSDPIEEAMSVPPGDAVGTDRSGEYEVEIYTAQCDGRCGANEAGFTISFCDVGNRDSDSVVASQNDGALRIDGDDGNYISRYTGGINTDGSFEVGGYATSLGGAIEAVAFVEGTFNGTGGYEAVADIHIWGTYDGQAVDCFATYEAEGVRSNTTD